VKFRDSFGPNRPRPTEQPGSLSPRFDRLAAAPVHSEPPLRPDPGIPNGADSGKLFTVKEAAPTHRVRRRIDQSDSDFNTFQDRLRMGKVKLCGSCGGVMAKSSRMVLSAPAGMGLIVVGALLMALHGFAINFYQPPWFLRYLLPAAYYVGSIMLGVGVIFFFIREKIWYCHRCGEIQKR
jgi:hypothetical protein